MARARPSRPPPTTPDGRYFVVRGRLWRCSRPGLPAEERAALVQRLMQARAALRRTPAPRPATERAAARAEVQRVKEALGERGPVWWQDGAPDYNRHLARNTPYREWYEAEEKKHAASPAS